MKNPYDTIDKLKVGGRIVICVPLETYSYKWKSDNVPRHLYRFSPNNLGNILDGAGFVDVQSKAIRHKRRPKYRYILRLFGLCVFHALSYVYYVYTYLPIRRRTKSHQMLATEVKPRA